MLYYNIDTLGDIMRHCVILCHIMLYCAIFYYNIVFYYVTLHDTVYVIL